MNLVFWALIATAALLHAGAAYIESGFPSAMRAGAWWLMLPAGFVLLRVFVAAFAKVQEEERAKRRPPDPPGTL